MALQVEAMVTSRTEDARLRIIPGISLSVIFAQAGAIKNLIAGTLVAYSTSSNGYIEFDDTDAVNGGDTIQGVIFPHDVEVTTAGEVAGVVMFTGEAHRADLVSGTAGGDAAIDAALETMIGRGLVVRALADVRSV